MDALRLSSPARALLDNFVPSRSRKGTVSRTLTKAEMEAHLEKLLRQSGEDQLNKLRDEARRIAPKLKRQREFKSLNKIIGALLNTRTDRLQTAVARARRKGLPFDPQRSELFEQLRAELHRTPFQTRFASSSDGTTLPFFDAYFSNFIEGTEFAVDEAAAIIFENRIPNARPQDAHDIIGTYRIVSNETEMRRTPRTFAEFERLLKHRHATIMVRAGQASRSIQDAAKSCLFDRFRRARPRSRNTRPGVQSPSVSGHAVPACRLYDVPGRRSSPVFRWQWAAVADHDEC